MTEVTESHTADHTAKKPKRSAKNLIRPISFALLIGAVAASLFLYYRTRQQVAYLSSPAGQQELSQREIQSVVESLGKLTLLPEEEPVVATVIDASYLATQSAFYKDAQNGDKLVVFPQAQKAYIYSPSRNILVNAGPLIVDQSQQQSVRVEIRNGTDIPGAGTRLREQIEGNGIEVISVTQASNVAYERTQIINLTDTVPDQQLAVFAQNLNAEVGQGLPPGEATSQADVLIIIGAEGGATAITPSPSPTSGQ